MVDSSREVTSGLRVRLLEAAAAIDEEEPKEDPPNTLEGSRAKLLEAAVAIDEEKARKDPPKLILNNAMEGHDTKPRSSGPVHWPRKWQEIVSSAGEG